MRLLFLIGRNRFGIRYLRVRARAENIRKAIRARGLENIPSRTAVDRAVERMRVIPVLFPGDDRIRVGTPGIRLLAELVGNDIPARFD